MHILPKPSSLLPLLLSFWLLLFLFIHHSIALVALSAGIDINAFFIPASLLLTSFLFFMIERKKIAWKISAIVAIISIIIVLVFPFIANFILDTTWDGQWYHQAAIAKIANGWNPILEPNYALTKYDATNYLWVPQYRSGKGHQFHTFIHFIFTGIPPMPNASNTKSHFEICYCHHYCL
jgi:hypothetical protein